MLVTGKGKKSSKISSILKSSKAAIDLASIMVGIIVIGLIGGVIASTIIAVIPWSQDNAAKQQLESVVSAQNAYLGIRANNTGGAATDAVRFGSKANLATENVLPAAAPVVIGVNLVDKDGSGPLTPITAVGTEAHYIGIVKSASGRYFWISDTRKNADSTSSLATAKTAAESSVTLPTAPSVFSWQYDGSV